MIYLDDATVRQALPWIALSDAIERTLRLAAMEAPDRLSFAIGPDDAATQGRLLIMPCWDPEESLGIKTVSYRPDNGQFGLPTHGANYILMHPRSGKVQAVLEAHEMTTRRTAAVSALAARYLAREDARNLLVVGTGPVALAAAAAHAAHRQLDRIEVFGRNPAKAERLVARLAAEGLPAQRCEDLKAAAGRADIVTMATSSHEPLLRGEWLAPGAHLDLIGSFTPQMREVDDAAMAAAGQVWVDTFTALDESGDLIGPMASGALSRGSIAGDLRQLVSQPRPERQPGAITVFKAVGYAVCDLAAARLALHNCAAAEPACKAAS